MADAGSGLRLGALGVSRADADALGLGLRLGVGYRGLGAMGRADALGG